MSVAMLDVSRARLDGERRAVEWFLRRVVDEQLDAGHAALTILVAVGGPAPVEAVEAYAEAVQTAERIEADPYEWAQDHWPDSIIGNRSHKVEWALGWATEYRKDAQRALDRIVGAS